MTKMQQLRMKNQVRELNVMTNTIQKTPKIKDKNELLYKMHGMVDSLQRDIKILLDDYNNKNNQTDNEDIREQAKQFAIEDMGLTETEAEFAIDDFGLFND